MPPHATQVPQRPLPDGRVRCNGEADLRSVARNHTETEPRLWLRQATSKLSKRCRATEMLASTRMLTNVIHPEPPCVSMRVDVKDFDIKMTGQLTQ